MKYQKDSSCSSKTLYLTAKGMVKGERMGLFGEACGISVVQSWPESSSPPPWGWDIPSSAAAWRKGWKRLLVCLLWIGSALFGAEVRKESELSVAVLLLQAAHIGQLQ